MITDKNGKEVKLNDILDFLVGTDDDDMAKSVIDFGLYPINEDKTIGAPYKYLVAVEAIVCIIHGAIYDAGAGFQECRRIIN